MGDPGDRDGDEALPEDLPRPTSVRDWELPTAWLLGTQLTASLRDMIASGLTEADVRDWMEPGPPIKIAPVDGADCVWLDFLADTGDSPLLVYRLAHLLQRPTLDVYTPADDRADAAPPGERPARRPSVTLPRGQVLVIGGDTAYPVSDADTLRRRMRAPFAWARQDLRAAGVAVTQDVPLVAIPGNHDYYNSLAGHVQMFRAPPPQAHPPQPQPHPPQPPQAHPPQPPLVTLPGYQRQQGASYFALDLAFGWQLWGLDVEFRGVDARQAAYFRELAERSTASTTDRPARIVVTSRPAVVYHGPSHAAAELAAVFEQVGLGPAHAQPFLREGQLLDATELRLDLSGDAHVYERYWGKDVEGRVEADDAAAALAVQVGLVAIDAAPSAPTSATASESVAASNPAASNRAAAPNETPEQPRYASVVSGLGGAFHHPGQVRLGGTAPRRSWPPAAASVQAIGGRLMRPMAVFQAGAVGLAGTAVALLCFGLTYLAGRRGDEPVNVLDVPLLDLSADPSGARTHFLVVLAAMVATVVGIGAIIGARILSRWLRHGPRPPALGDALIERRRRTPTPGRASRRARYQAWLRRGVRRGWVRGLTALLGANRDNVEVAVLTGPVWLAVVAIWGGLLYVGYTSCGLRAAADGFLPLYVVVGLVLMGMMALGAAVAPAPRTVGRTDATPPLAQPAPWGARVAFTLGALVAGALIVWLPYAWTRVIAAGGWHVALIGVVVFYRLVTPVARWILGRRVWRRRFGLLALAVVLLGAYVVVPIVAMPARADLRPPPALALLLTAYFGAYFTCLVFGWYLLLCLQWNGHGNEAGGAARVVDYAEFVRIKLTRDRAEVWVIAAADRGPDAPPPRPSWWTRTRAWMSMRLPPPHDHVGTATLVDHFTIERPPSTAPAAPAAPPPA